MDGSRFDALAKSLSVPGSRRRLLAGLAAALGLVASPVEAARPGTLSLGVHCRKDADCKSGYCQHNPKLRRQASGTCRCPEPTVTCHGACCVGVPNGRPICVDGKCDIECDRAADPCDGVCCAADQFCEADACVACRETGVACASEFECCSGVCDTYLGQCSPLI
jgi:hypothetical protein